MKESTLEMLAYITIFIIALFVIVFHGVLKPPPEHISENCKGFKMYQESQWPWWNHVKCLDGE
jgi:hypothetical protein